MEPLPDPHPIPALGGPLRRILAAGEHLRIYPPGHTFQLRIDSAHGMPGWKARVSGTVTRPAFPGSAVLFEGRLYEVLQQEDASGRGFAYFLGDWDDRFPSRQLFTYSAEECARLAAERRRIEAQDRSTLLMQLARPFVGMLPAQDQIRLESTHGLTALRGTILSAALFLLLGGFATTRGVIGFLFGAPPGELHLYLRLLPLSAYMAAESAFRLLLALHIGVPAGSLPVAGPVYAVRLLGRLFVSKESSSPVAELGDRERKRTWVETFAPLWGLLDPPAQERLAELYGYDAARNTAISAVGVVVLALAAVTMALGYLLDRRGGLLDLGLLVVATFLLFENVRRLRIANQGNVSGSVLGKLLRPFASRLLV